MDAGEFNSRFLRTARTMWPDSLGRWLGKLPAAGRGQEGEPSYQDVMGLWRATLADVPIEPALEVLHEMYAGSIGLPGGDRYTRWSSLPGVVAQGVNGRREPGQHGARVIDGELTYRCGVCLDQGHCIVWTRAAVEAAMVFGLREYVADPKKPNGITMPCCCDLGRKLARVRGARHYEPTKHWLCQEPINDETIEHIESRAAQSIQWQP